MAGLMPRLVLVLAAAAAAAGCNLLEPARDESGQVQKEANVGVTTVRTGDCIEKLEEAEVVSNMRVVPCTTPHEGEVFHSFELPAGDYPGEEELRVAAEKQCDPAFGTFVGKPVDESKLTYYSYTPDKATWDSGDRRARCVITDPAGMESKSLRNAKR